MLKGHTKIELTDVNTGDVEVIEKDNMVTGAIEELFQIMPTITTSQTLTDGSYPYYQMMSSILLFDTAQEESVDTFFPSGESEMTGCGVYQSVNATADKARGSYNEDESKIDTLNKTMTLVYDFNTQQANGTIASVCLTHKDGAYAPYGVKEDWTTDVYAGGALAKIANTKNFTLSGFYLLFVKDDKAYYGGSTAGAIQIKIANVNANNISLFGAAMSNIGDTETVTINTTVTASDSSWYEPCWYVDDQRKRIYTTDRKPNIKSNETFNVIEIDMDTLSVLKEYVVTNTTDGTASVMYVLDGYVYLKKTSDFYKVKLDNSTDMVLLVSGLLTSDGRQTFSHVGDWIYISCLPYSSSNTPLTYVLNTKKNTVRQCEGKYLLYYKKTYSAYYRVVPIVGKKNVFLLATEAAGGDAMISYFPGYLATINNLDSPVTKTSAQTMKITYTVTEEQ